MASMMKYFRCFFFLSFFGITQIEAMDIFGFLRQFGVNSPEQRTGYEVIFPELYTSQERSEVTSRAAISTKNLHLALTAFGEQFHIRVSQESSFVVGDLKVDYISGPLSDSTQGKHLVRTDCYYRGTLDGHTESVVSLSACNGIMAFIHTEAQTLYIEPLDDTETVNLSEKRHKRAVPHIIYKGKTREVADWECDVIDGETDYYAAANLVQFQLNDVLGLTKKYVETLVVGDSALYDQRGDNTANSLLTLMNAVAHVLSLPSLIGDKLQLVVVNMTIFTTNTGDLVTTGNAYKTLFDFCQWQNMTNPIDEANPRHYDIATLLTGRDIYGNHGNGTKGIALVGRACMRERQGSLVEFLDMDAIYATAHEIGHSLGMHHDGHHGNTCPEEGFLMCYHMQDNLEKLGWSTCSRSYLLNFLNSTGTCFEDVPGINLIPAAN